MNKRKSLFDIWNQVPITYYQRGVKTNIFQKIWHKRKIDLAKEIIRKIPSKNCLDVGCASGYMLSQISKDFPKARYFGVDVYKKAIDYAKKTYPNINFKVSSAERLPFKDNQMNLVICYETIEHVENPRVLLKEIKRVLRKDGKLVLAMDSGSFLFRLVWLIWENSTGRVWRGSHLHPFQHKELDNIIIESGFRIDSKRFSHLGMEVVYVLIK